VIWGIWISRNNVIFKGLELNITQVAHKIRVSFKGIWKPLKGKSHIIMKEPSIDCGKSWVFLTRFVKGIQESVGLGKFYILILLGIFL